VRTGSVGRVFRGRRILDVFAKIDQELRDSTGCTAMPLYFSLPATVGRVVDQLKLAKPPILQAGRLFSSRNEALRRATYPGHVG
jgi:hypothetical protein